MFHRQFGLARDPFWKINALFDLKNLVSLVPLCQVNVVVLVLHHSENDMSVILSRSAAEAKNLVVCLGKCPCLPKTRFFVASLLRMTDISFSLW
jgi:hypothetical protein